jgi:hypothetical protein
VTIESYVRVPGEMLGAAVAAEILVASSPDTACLVRHLAATPEGIYFLLVVRLREPLKATEARSSGERLMRELDDLWRTPTTKRKRRLAFHVSFSDGREFWPTKMGYVDPDAVDLEAAEGGGHPTSWELKYRLAALPPRNGTVTFHCSWQSRGLNGHAGIAANDILDAAAQATPIFAT